MCSSTVLRRSSRQVSYLISTLFHISVTLEDMLRTLEACFPVKPKGAEKPFPTPLLQKRPSAEMHTYNLPPPPKVSPTSHLPPPLPPSIIFSR